VNVGPAIAADGTIYTVSRAHFDARVGYLIAVNPDLTPKWQASLQHRLNDGCGVIVPIATNTTTPNSCRPGTTPGVDPTTNDLGSGSVIDQASSSPTVLPDGSILFGAITNYNSARGHMFKFDSRATSSGHSTSVGFHAFGLPARRHLFHHHQGQSLRRRRPLLRESRSIANRFRPGLITSRSWMQT